MKSDTKKRPAKRPAKKSKQSASSSTSSAPKRGRPRGSKTTKRDIVTVAASRCRKCGSTDRAPYSQTKSRQLTGCTPAGEPYNRVSWKRTKCKSCGQARVDKIFELVDQQAEKAKNG